MTHVHKYQLMNLSQKPDKVHLVYRCILPNCNHYQNPYRLALGKESLCHNCDNIMVISDYEISHKRKRPVCWDCKQFRRRPKK